MMLISLSLFIINILKNNEINSLNTKIQELENIELFVDNYDEELNEIIELNSKIVFQEDRIKELNNEIFIIENLITENENRLNYK